MDQNLKWDDVDSFEYVTQDVQIGDLWDQSGEHKYNGVSDEKLCATWVLTPSGPLLANRVFRTKGSTLKVAFSSGRDLEGLPEHRVLAEDGRWTFLRDLTCGSRVLSVDGADEVTAISEGADQLVYDIHVPVYHHYYANGLVSHNSALANAIGMNWAEMGERVLKVPLEMSEEEETSRMLARISGIDVRKIILNKLSPSEKETVEKKTLRWLKKVKAKGGRYTLFKPRQDMAIEEILSVADTYGPKVVIIDYISLLKGMDDEDQWRKLGAVARYCKIWADTNNKIVVLLAQLSEEGKIRYAQAVKEHADYAWTFVATKETRENKIINVEPIKGRNAELFPFSLRADLSVMQITDLDHSDPNDDQDEGGAPKGRKTYDTDLSEEE